MSRVAWAALTAVLVAGAAHGAPAKPDLHASLMTLDTHLDTPIHFTRSGWDLAARHDPATELAKVDLARMADGDLDGGFFAIFTAQGPLTPAGYDAAIAFAFKRSGEIDATLAHYADRITPALSADDAERIVAGGRLVAFKSIENSYPLGEDLGLLDRFYAQGVRLAGVVHTTDNQFADSATDKPRWNGLSPLGRRWVAEMNRLGIVIDASHASDATFDQMLTLSKTPLLLSHSGARAVYDHPRNLDDARIRRLAASGGAICFTTIYLSKLQLGPERAALFDRVEHIGAETPAAQAELTRRWHDLDTTEPMWAADLDTYMAGLLHVIKVAGTDHVCFGADWDGGGGLRGLHDISDYPKVTARLKAAGLSDADLAKMWSGNVLRILRAAEAARSARSG